MVRRTKRLGDRRGGYVLIEAMAALVLSGLVLASVPIASGMLIRSWQSVTRGSDRLDQLATGLGVVRRELSVMQRTRFAPKRRNRGDDGPPVFIGTPDTVGMVLPGDAVRTGPNADKGDRIVMFTVEPGVQGATLLRGSTPYRPELTGFETVQLQDPVILLDGPWRYQFLYAAADKERLQWLPVWDREERLPVAIRLDVVDNATGIRVIPPLIVPLQITAEPGCIDSDLGPCGK